jgi:hypothetical protein
MAGISYHEFLEKKIIRQQPSGFRINNINDNLFDWQKKLVEWALYRGRAALFEGCGLGKTLQQLEWSFHVNKKTNMPVLILAPLAVSRQTVREGEKFGIDVNLCKSHDDIKNCINITNYERLHLFYPDGIGGIVLDEGGIIKNFAGKIRNQIIDTFLRTQYKLCATATPAPNDYPELGNTSEFLGIMTRPEMLSMFFINDTSDTGTWRLKGHVKDNKYWEWLASWSVMIQKPSDVGYPDDGFILPQLKTFSHVIPYNGPKTTLFTEEARTLQERRRARQESIEARVDFISDIINSSNEPWIAWCGLNAESELLTKKIKDSVEVRGSSTPGHKENAMLDFQDNKIKCLVTKPSIAGHGMNWQNCSNMAFVGLSDSFEEYYQAVRRCWRFGQLKPVRVHIVTEEREGSVFQNVMRKETQMQTMLDGMVSHMQKLMEQEMRHSAATKTIYNPQKTIRLPHFIEEVVKYERN